MEKKIAFAIVEQLLKDAPLHLRAPAIEELSRLSRQDLALLVHVDSLASGSKELQRIMGAMQQPAALDRLIKRFQLAKAIAEAREAGLYDRAEHVANSVVGAVSEVEVATDAASEVVVTV
jgi:hypothetical protein